MKIVVYISKYKIRHHIMVLERNKSDQAQQSKQTSQNMTTYLKQTQNIMRLEIEFRKLKKEPILIKVVKV